MMNIFFLVLIYHPYILFGERCVHEQSFAHFLTGLFDYLLLSFMSSLYILHTRPFVRYLVCKYFLPVCSLSLHSFNSVFCKAKVFNFYQFLTFTDHAFGVMSKNSLPNCRHNNIVLFSSKNYIVLHFTFRTNHPF